VAGTIGDLVRSAQASFSAFPRPAQPKIDALTPSTSFGAAIEDLARLFPVALRLQTAADRSLRATPLCASLG
jgi:hypothetical protein